jgi:hypothetical protein
MTVYWVVFSFLSLFSVLTVYLKNKEIRGVLLLSSYLILVLFIGLRDQTGSDWNHYKDYFLSLRDNVIENHFEVGYFSFAKILNIIGLNYLFFLLFSTFLYLSLMFYVFVSHKYAALISLIFFCSHLLPLMGQARQAIALALCLVAGKLLLLNRGLSFFIVTIVASLFHKSAIIFLLSYLVINYKVRAAHILAAVLVVCVSYFISQNFNYSTLLLHFIPGDIGTHLTAYIVSEENTPIFYIDDYKLVLLVFTKRIFFALIFFCSQKFISSYSREYNFYLNLYFLSLLIFLMLYNLFPAIAIRLALYFYVYDVFLFSIIVANSRGVLKFFLIIMIIIICLQRLSVPLLSNSDFLVPYNGLLFIDGASKDMPY